MGTDPKCICVYFIYLLFFIFILWNCFRFWQTISRYRSRDSFEIAVPYNIPRAHKHTHTQTHKQQQTNALQSNSQFSARFIPGMIAGRSRRKIGRYTYNIYVYTHSRSPTHGLPPASPPDNIVYAYTTRVLSQSNRTLSSAASAPTRPSTSVNPKVDTRPPARP